MSNTDESKVDALTDDIYRGLELTVEKLQGNLPDTVDQLSAKQLRRALKAVISYPDIDPDDAQNMSDAEQRFNAGLLALHQAGVQLEIKAIGELQRDHDRKQQEHSNEA